MYQRYGLLGCIRIIISYIYTKLVFPHARLIRLPFDIRNKRFIKIGKGFTCGFGCRVEAHPLNKKNISSCLIIGNDVEINDYVHIAAGQNIIIGDNVLIASKVFITDINHGQYKGDNADSPASKPNDRALSASPVVIEENVWLGENVCVMPGVTIGRGSIIGASSVITKTIPANVIAAGNPAKIIKKYNFETGTWDANY